jgi:hypothetical protein
MAASSKATPKCSVSSYSQYSTLTSCVVQGEGKFSLGDVQSSLLTFRARWVPQGPLSQHSFTYATRADVERTTIQSTSMARIRGSIA